MIQVTLLDTMELATFCVRTFSLHKVSSGDSTSITFLRFDLLTYWQTNKNLLDFYTKYQRTGQ